MYGWAMGRDHVSRQLEQYLGNESSLFDAKALYDLPGMPTITFEILKPKLLTPEQIQAELRMTESWGRHLRGDVSESTRESLTVVDPTRDHLEIDWSGFKDWLFEQYSRSTCFLRVVA